MSTQPNTYSKILLIRLAWDKTDDKISNTLDYQTVLILTYSHTDNFSLLLLHLGCTTNQRNLSFGYLLHLLVPGHQGPLLCLLESSYLKKLMDHKTSGQEKPQWLMYNPYWRPSLTCPWDLTVSLLKLFIGKK